MKRKAKKSFLIGTAIATAGGTSLLATAALQMSTAPQAGASSEGCTWGTNYTICIHITGSGTIVTQMSVNLSPLRGRGTPPTTYLTLTGKAPTFSTAYVQFHGPYFTISTRVMNLNGGISNTTSRAQLNIGELVSEGKISSNTFYPGSYCATVWAKNHKSLEYQDWGSACNEIS